MYLPMICYIFFCKTDLNNLVNVRMSISKLFDNHCAMTITSQCDKNIKLNIFNFVKNRTAIA